MLLVMKMQIAYYHYIIMKYQAFIMATNSDYCTDDTDMRFFININMKCVFTHFMLMHVGHTHLHLHFY